MHSHRQRTASWYGWNSEFPTALLLLARQLRPYDYADPMPEKWVRIRLAWNSAYKGSWPLSYWRVWKVNSLIRRSTGQYLRPHIYKIHQALSSDPPGPYWPDSNCDKLQVRLCGPMQSLALGSFGRGKLESTHNPNPSKEQFQPGCREVDGWR